MTESDSQLPMAIEYESKVNPLSPGLMTSFTLKPIGKPTFSLVIVLSMMMLIGTSAPAGYFVLLVITLLSAALLGIWIFIRLMCRIFAQYLNYGQVILDRSWLRWVLVTLIATSTCLISASGLSMKIGYWISQRSMERFVTQIQTTKPTKPISQWCGIYPVIYSPDKTPSGMIILRVNSSGFVSSGYFVYTASSPNLGDHPPKQIAPNWWTWIRD